MGLIRKTMSLSTMGAVDFRSDKERIARSTRQTNKSIKQQTRAQEAQHQAHMQALAAQQQAMMAQQQAQAIAAATAPPAIQGPPPGWYPDQANQSMVRWFDGVQWTDFTQPRQG